jgi:hypothetical protein
VPARRRFGLRDGHEPRFCLHKKLSNHEVPTEIADSTEPLGTSAVSVALPDEKWSEECSREAGICRPLIVRLADASPPGFLTSGSAPDPGQYLPLNDLADVSLLLWVFSKTDLKSLRGQEVQAVLQRNGC